MDNVKYNLFCNAVLETSLEMIDDELKKSKENASVSIKRTRQFNKAFDTRVHFRPSPKQIVAILIAATVLFLAGCGVVYRDKIREFIVNVYNEFILVKFSKEKTKTKDFAVFEVGYIPDGHELKEETVSPTFVKRKWTNADEFSFSITQSHVEQTSFFQDVNYIETDYLFVNEIKVLYYKYETKKCYIWNDGKYAFCLDTDIDFQDEEAIKIIEGVFAE